MWITQHITPDPLKTGKRIACLVPSITELLLHLQLGKQLIARTKFCIHPKDLVDKIPVVGGTKKINIQKLAALAPDLVIGNIEENVKEDIEMIADFAPVYLSDIKNIQDIKKFLFDLTTYIPELQISAFLDNLDHLEIPNLGQNNRVIYLIWKDPWMSVGGDTYIHHILEIAGFVNVCKDVNRYPVLGEEDLIKLNPKFIFLSSEPFPFNSKHVSFFKNLLPGSKTYLVDGEVFSWYGKKTLEIGPYLRTFMQREDFY